MPLVQSPLAFTLPWYNDGIPKGYWQEGIVPNGKLLSSFNPDMPGKPVDTEYLWLMAYSPNPGSVRYTGDEFYPQFSEAGYYGQCVAFAKAVSARRTLSTSSWEPGISLLDYVRLPESKDVKKYQWMMIACFDGQANYSLALSNKKHVAILLKIERDATGKVTGIIVADQNYYNYWSYTQYEGKIAKHTIPWGTIFDKWTGFARAYHIVNIR